MRIFLIIFIAFGNAKATLAEVSVEAINNGAHYLAGLPLPYPGEANSALSKTGAWKSHAAALSKQVDRHETATLRKMQTWSKTEVAPYFPKGGVVRYLFSGPDILHPLRIFPEAGSFVMGGLEPVGVVPDLARLKNRSASNALAGVRKSLEEIVHYSFFKTKDMKVDLRGSAFPGTTPLLCLFLAASGQEITKVKFFKLLDDGSLEKRATDAKDATAVRIQFKEKRGKQIRSLTYFQANVADGEIEKNGFLKYLQSLEKGGAYAKAASYLMHKSYFSTVRKHLMDYSQVLVEDDSGIPLRHFEKTQWNLNHYGAYLGPIPLFKGHYQSDLQGAYRSGKAKSLPFGTGYRWRMGTSNLLVAVRNRKSAASVAAAVATPQRPPHPANLDKTRASRKTVTSAKDLGPPDTFTPEPVVLSLKLLAKSVLPDPEEIPQGKALGAYEYVVLRVHSGDFPYRTIRVADGLFWNGRPTRVVNRPIGTTISMALVPLSHYQSLQNVPCVDQLKPGFPLPLYTPRLD